MKLNEVKKLDPINRLAYWIYEREAIRAFKEAGVRKPWTDDEILQSYRFCNVRRMDDTVSKWLMENWYEPNPDCKHMLLAVALARFINLPASLNKITNLVFRKTEPNWVFIKGTLRNYRDEGNTIFNGAYMVRGNDGMDKIECVVDYYVRPLTTVRIFTDSMAATHRNILTSYGMGDFMAGQVTADLRWAVEGEWKDAMGWAPMGPGSQRGMNWLLGRDIKFKWKQEAFTYELLKTVDLLEKLVDDRITSRLELMDYQNCMCEFDKYSRTLAGTSKPKQKYPGAK